GQLGTNVRLAGTEEVRADDDAVPIDRRRADVRHVERDLAVRAEAFGARAVRRVPRDDLPERREEDPRRDVAVAGPVAHAAERREPLVELVHPDFLAGLRAKRDDAIAGRHVHHAVDDDRRDLLVELERRRPRDRPSRTIEAVVPDELEIRDVPRRDLVEGRVARAREVAMVVRPVGGRASIARGPDAGRPRAFLLGKRAARAGERDGRRDSMSLRTHWRTPPSMYSNSVRRRRPIPSPDRAPLRRASAPARAPAKRCRRSRDAPPRSDARRRSD